VAGIYNRSTYAPEKRAALELWAGHLMAAVEEECMMDAFVPPCIPTAAVKPPAGPDWVHKIKHDGYRLQSGAEGDAVRLFTRRG